jgi:hypothetical protein
MTGLGDSDSGTSEAEPESGVPYAHVVAVEATGSARDYTFSVTVRSADVDCSQYADWWEVLSADGALLYRRVLVHSHTDANGTTDADAEGNTFTRTGGPVPVGDDDEVVVRAHMNVGGYHGDVMTGRVSAGFRVDPDPGAEFAASVEAQQPQPTGCLF